MLISSSLLESLLLLTIKAIKAAKKAIIAPIPHLNHHWFTMNVATSDDIIKSSIDLVDSLPALSFTVIDKLCLFLLSCISKV